MGNFKKMIHPWFRFGVTVKNIRADVDFVTDKSQDCTAFYHLIDDELKKNRLLLVIKIDHCSRNTREFLKIRARLNSNVVKFNSFYSIDKALTPTIIIFKKKCLKKR